MNAYLHGERTLQKTEAETFHRHMDLGMSVDVEAFRELKDTVQP